jgi:hypothetical protein
MTDDRHDDLLRQILASEAEAIVPEGDGLMKIQARTAGHGARSRWLIPASALGVAALVAGAFVLGSQLNGDRDNDSLNPPPAGSPTPTATTEPTTTPTPSPAPVGTGQAWVYYLHDDGQHIRLYRERHTLPGVVSPEAAVQEALTGTPDDPDYTSLWPKATLVRSVTVSGDTAVVDLSAEAKGQANSGAEGESLSVQQLVYTVTANNNAVKKVELRVAGQKVSDLWGHGFGANPASRAPQIDVQGFVWLLSPTQGATVGSPVKLSGIGCTFEATVNIEIVQNGNVVKELNTMTDGGCPHFGPWSLSVQLSPGDYLVRAFEASAKDGSATYIDDKAITVK